MTDCLEVVEEGGYVGVLLLVSSAVIVASFSSGDERCGMLP